MANRSLDSKLEIIVLREKEDEYTNTLNEETDFGFKTKWLGLKLNPYKYKKMMPILVKVWNTNFGSVYEFRKYSTSS